MYMPATCPIREGDAIRVQFNHVDREELTQLKDQEISGVVVRVDHKAVVKLARLAVGIRFDEPQ
jgi:hypothetical protein